MKTSAVRSLRYLTSKIHPPLPLDTRDSQKLLTLLKTSFRAQLDQEHGIIGSSKTSAAEVHLQSVLDNPLFSVPPRPELSPDNGKTQKSKCSSTGTTEGVEGLHRNSVQHLEAQFRSGTASNDIAKLCLEYHFKSFNDVPARRANLELQWKVSTVMLHWLHSSGRESTMIFLRDKRLVSFLIPFLIADGRDRRVYHWLERLRLGLMRKSPNLIEDHVFSENIRVQAHIVFTLIKSEMHYGSGLNSALREFLENVGPATEWINQFPDLQKARPSSFVARRILNGAGNYILDGLGSAQTRSVINLINYERLFESTESWSNNVSLHRALLALRHPVAPNPLLSLQYIREEMPKARRRRTPKQRLQVVNLCLDTSKLLLSQGKHAEAEWVLNFVSQTFPLDIGCSETHQHAAASSQQQESTAKTESGLRELEALAFE
ncbi:hypothetical protein MMC26_001823 [Xylographa opegraphella]|nr:hypothetical protein [Xylographa opegraphella]